MSTKKNRPIKIKEMSRRARITRHFLFLMKVYFALIIDSSKYLQGHILPQ